MMKTAEIVIRPIRNQKDYESAVKIIDSLLDCPTGSREEEILEVISILVDEYEKIHYPIGEPDPIEYLKYRMEQTNLSQKDLVKYLGGKNRASEVLSKKRPLTLKMIRNLHRGLGIPLETLLAQ